MDPHISSYLSKYFVELFWLHPRQHTDYIHDGVMITVLVLTPAWGMLERSMNKSQLWNQKRCLFLDVRTSSLEADLHVPGNRDEFPFSLVEWSLPS